MQYSSIYSIVKDFILKIEKSDVIMKLTCHKEAVVALLVVKTLLLCGDCFVRIYPLSLTSL